MRSRSHSCLRDCIAQLAVDAHPHRCVALKISVEAQECMILSHALPQSNPELLRVISMSNAYACLLHDRV